MLDGELDFFPKLRGRVGGEQGRYLVAILQAEALRCFRHADRVSLTQVAIEVNRDGAGAG